MVRSLHLPGMSGLLFWRDGFVLEHGEHLAYLEYDCREYTVGIRCRVKQSDPNPGWMLRSLVEVVEALITCYYTQLAEMTERLIPCTHCIRNTKSSGQPYLFTYAECIQAITNGKPFVFCHHIPSASRCIPLLKLAPDIAFADLPVIDGRLLQIDKQIGSGGFGLVFCGSYQQTNVAVKELKFLIGDDQERVTKFRDFQQEAWIMW
jgi:hypothetical protein